MSINLPITGFAAPRSDTAEKPQFRDPRVMRAILEEVWQAVTDQHLPLDREYLISMLLVRDARTRARLEAQAPGPALRAN
jgi:hypothetical protein